MDAVYIAESLDLRRYGTSWRGACPVCGGSDRSTKFALREDGDRLLVHCFSGCSQEAVIAELRSRGLWPDATPEQRQRYREYRHRQELESGRTWFAVADSAVERGESLTKRERQRHYLLKRLYGGEHG